MLGRRQTGRVGTEAIRRIVSGAELGDLPGDDALATGRADHDALLADHGVGDRRVIVRPRQLLTLGDERRCAVPGLDRLRGAAGDLGEPGLEVGARQPATAHHDALGHERQRRAQRIARHDQQIGPRTGFDHAGLVGLAEVAPGVGGGRAQRPGPRHTGGDEQLDLVVQRLARHDERDARVGAEQERRAGRCERSRDASVERVDRAEGRVVLRGGARQLDLGRPSPAHGGGHQVDPRHAPAERRGVVEPGQSIERDQGRAVP